jgi:hypothetical protein
MNNLSLKTRREKYQEAFNKYGDQCYVVMVPDKSLTTKTSSALKHKKYIIHWSDTFSSLTINFRKSVKLPSDVALFFFSESNELIPQSLPIRLAYDRYHNREDKFLYVKVMSESTFG